MTTLLTMPDVHHAAKRSVQTGMHWHRYAFEIFPAPFGAHRLLDVGCGGGGVAAHAQQLGWNPTGVDGAPANIDSLAALGIPGRVADLNSDLPFADGSFELVTFIEVAEHLVRAEHTFAEIARVLVPGGMLLFTTPNNAFYRRRLRALKGKAPDDEGYHFRFWVRAQLEKKLESAGLRVEARNSYGYLPLVDLPQTLATGRKRVFSIGPAGEALFADRFVWLLSKSC